MSLNWWPPSDKRPPPTSSLCSRNCTNGSQKSTVSTPTLWQAGCTVNRNQTNYRTQSRGDKADNPCSHESRSLLMKSILKPLKILNLLDIWAFCVATLRKADVPHSVAFLNRTPIFEWYVVWCDSKHKYQEDIMCLQ